VAAGTQELEAFVRDALARGASRPSIEAALAAAGWPQEQVRSALAAWAEVPFAVPVPRPRPYLSAREAFFYLVLFATLYAWAYHLGSLLFDLIAHAWPDPAEVDWRAGGRPRSMRFSVATLVVAFPVFLLVARRLGRELARNPVKRLSAIRRWLTYMTLFVAAAVLVGDSVALVYNLLGGELTARFLAKVLVVAAIAGGIFGYYLLDLRREEQEP
jgi:hypothetical protein